MIRHFPEEMMGNVRPADVNRIPEIWKDQKPSGCSFSLRAFALLYIELIGHNFFPVFVEKLFAILTEVQEGLQIVILCQIRESDGRVLQVLILDQLSCSGLEGSIFLKRVSYTTSL